MVWAIRMFQLVIVVLTVIHFIREKCKTNCQWHYFRISKWVFRLCAFVCFGLSFGIAAILEDRATDQYAIAVLFALACLYALMMMALQTVWQIKYNHTCLIFRNFLGISKAYDLKQLQIVEEDRMTHLKYCGQTVTKWDSSMMDVKQEIALHNAFAAK